MKKAVPFLLGFLLFGCAFFSAKAAFTNFCIFGDGLSTTTNGPGGPSYYGLRRSNGRVWVEVLAQRQGLTYNPNQNWSYFGNTSTTMVATVSSFNISPSVASNTLFVVWVNNADLFYPALNSGANMNAWISAINISLTNHFKAVTNLYAKGARTLIMPNAVDLSTIPAFNSNPNTNFYHQRVIDYNIAFANTLNRLRASCPGLTIYSPDFFALLTNLLATPAEYGVTNALDSGYSVDVIEDPLLSNKTMNGPGTNYIFWDSTDPSAKVHTWMANLAQQLISPAQISQLTVLDGSNRLDLVNVPVGQNGLVLGCTNQLTWKSWSASDWTTNASFSSINTTQSVFIPIAGNVSSQARQLSPKVDIDPGGGGGTNPVVFISKMQLYQLSFPYSWTWP